MSEISMTGRNEPCPCGSGKKYKRCCGVQAAPKLSVPKPLFDGGSTPNTSADGAPSAGMANPFEGMDPAMLTQFTKAIQRLPKGQMQRLQSIMRKAMSGKDVMAEAQEFEKSLPVEFQSLLKSMGSMAAMSAQANGAASAPQAPEAMTEEQARELVKKAAQEGSISQEKAAELLAASRDASPAATPAVTPGALTGPETTSSTTEAAASESKLGRFWRGLSGRKNS